MEDTKYLKLMWAKTNPYKSILAHSLDSAAVAEVLLTGGIFGCVVPDLADWLLGNHLDNTQQDILHLLLYLCALHDIGKINPLFVGKRDEKGVCTLLRSENIAKEYKYDAISFRHEEYTKKVLLRIWEEKNRFERILARREDSTADNLALVLRLHHQGKTGEGKEIPECDAKKLWEMQQDILEEIIYNMFQPPKVILNSKTNSHVSAVCMMILGLVVISDWLASSDAFENCELYEEEDCICYYHRVRQKAQKLVKKSRLSATMLPEGKRFTDVWTGISRQGMRSLQMAAEQIMSADEKPLLLLIEAPMGEGKTEAGAYAAFRMGDYFGKRGFYVALPTSATANQMYGRMSQLIKSMFPKEQVRLLHSTAWLSDEATQEAKEITLEDKEDVQEWTKPLRRGLLEGYSVGTIDQVLMSALHVKYGVIRLLGMQNKVLVLDEVHAYDAYMQDILLRMLEWCRVLRIPVVMLSATLATETKKGIMEVYGADYKGEQIYPAITAVFQDGRYQVTPVLKVSKHQTITVHIKPILHQPKAICDCALHTVQKGGCLCVLVNTVKQAQEIYCCLKETAGDNTQLYLFHARFSEKQKRKLEKQMIALFGTDKSKRPHRAIVVTTQIMEQSLDVDFDFMITGIAPIDLLLQRFGRQFRHENTPRPAGCDNAKAIVLVPAEGEDYGANELVYPPVLLDLSIQYLKEHPQLSIPEKIREAVEFVYGNEAVQHADMEKWMERMFQEEIKRSQAKNYELRKPEKKYFNTFESADIFDDSETSSFLSAKTRLTEPTKRIAVVPQKLYERVKEEDRVSKQLAQEVFLHSVTIREEIIKPYEEDMKNAGALEGKGLLKFMQILPGQDGAAYINKNVIFDLNEEFGFLIQGR